MRERAFILLIVIASVLTAWNIFHNSENNKHSRDGVEAVEVKQKHSELKKKKRSYSTTPSWSNDLEGKADSDAVFIPKRLEFLFNAEEENIFLDYKNKLAFIKSLGGVSQEERQAMYHYLKSEKDDKYTLHLKDEILIVIENNEYAPEFIPTMIAMVENQNLDGDFRGYVMQHLRTAYESRSGEREMIKKSIENGVNDLSSDVSGTALLALSNLIDKYPNDFDRSQVVEAVVRTAENASVYPPSRTTALQLCGKLKIESAYPVVINILEQPSETVLKLVAISALGDIGSQQDIALLEKLQQSNSRLYKNAFKLALNKLKNK